MLNSLSKKISRVQAEIPYRTELAKHRRNLPSLSTQDQAIVEACRRDGAYITTLQDLGLPSTPLMLASAEQYLQKLRADFLMQADSDTPTYPHALTVTYLPEFATWGREPRLQNIIENYIGLPIEFHGAQLQRDFANKKQVLAELWHKDAEDRRMIKVIVYLTDVDEEHGPFQYIPKSKVSASAWRKVKAAIARASDLGISDAEMETLIPRSHWKSCTGPAGTVIFVDTKAVLHHGKTRTKERSALFFVYTSDRPLHPEYCMVYKDDSFIKPGFVRPNT
jgi:hypothetical protein